MADSTSLCYLLMGEVYLLLGVFFVVVVFHCHLALLFVLLSWPLSCLICFFEFFCLASKHLTLCRGSKSGQEYCSNPSSCGEVYQLILIPIWVSVQPKGHCSLPEIVANHVPNKTTHRVLAIHQTGHRQQCHRNICKFFPQQLKALGSQPR